MRQYYKALLQIRREHPALSRGDYAMISGPKDAVLAYIRHDKASGDAVAVLVNREDMGMMADVILPESWKGKPVRDELSSEEVTIAAERMALAMGPKSVRILSTDLGRDSGAGLEPVSRKAEN
jgi:glycosidase